MTPSINYYYFLNNKKSGVVTDEGDGMILKEHIDALVKKTFEPSSLNKPGYIITFCDPNGGGPNHMALVSIACLSGQIIVCNVFF